MPQQRNLSVKLSSVLSRFKAHASAQQFMDLSISEACERFWSQIPDTAKMVISYGFDKEAIFEIIEGEFVFNVEENRLVFNKLLLDAESIERASHITKTFSQDEEIQLDGSVDWLFDVTRDLYRENLEEDRIADIRREYRAGLKLYAQKFSSTSENKLYTLFASQKAMVAFINMMTVDAMYKADAAKELFGETSSYYQAWLRKQMFRHMISKRVSQFILSYAA